MIKNLFVIFFFLTHVGILHAHDSESVVAVDPKKIKKLLILNIKMQKIELFGK
jgi:hypothetical protein